MGRGWKTFEKHGRKILDSLEQIFGGNTDITDAPGGVIIQSKACVNGN